MICGIQTAYRTGNPGDDFYLVIDDKVIMSDIPKLLFFSRDTQWSDMN